MRRLLWITPVLGLAALGGLFALRATSAPQPPGPDPVAVDTVAPALPVKQAVLFSSGVGYFQREGQVEGAARVDLMFPERDVNDLIKSMVLRDLDGGSVSAVSYDSRDPVERTLKSFAIDLTGNPTQGAILNQARGERVEVASQVTGTTQPALMSGVIVGVETHKQAAGKDAVDVELLNLWCADGMRAVKLADVQRLRFLNPATESEFRRALETLAGSHDARKKAVSVQFAGEGKRRVRVGYVVESPVWKTTYRLVLDKQNKPFLQGWAVVENTSDEDWAGVNMALISGRPISFQMDLYQPLYATRPTVEPELFASLRPPTYEGDMAGRDKANATRFGLAAGVTNGREVISMRGVNVAEAEGPKLALSDGSTAAMVNGESLRRKSKGEKQVDELERLSELTSVKSAATSSNLGDYFQYLVDAPVSLARQKSAMLPIVTKDVEAARVSIYNETVQAKHPLLGLRFKITSGAHLMQGPITVYDNSTYAGDARVMDLTPGDERLISYAVDLSTEVTAETPEPARRLVRVRLARGVLIRNDRTREHKVYKAVNRSQQERTLLVEHPYRADRTLVDTAKPLEQARDVHRFEMKLAAGQGGTLHVTEESDARTDVQIANTDDNGIRFFINQAVADDKVKAALARVLELRGELARVSADLAHHNRELGDIAKDQERLRANLREVPAGTAAHTRYVKKFDDQETQVERLNGRIKELQADEVNRRKALDDYLATLDLG